MIPPARGRLNWDNLSSALVLAVRLVLHVGILSDYRKPFWRAARYALRRGQIDAVFGMGFIAHHLIQFTREALRGEQNASYYSTKLRTASAAPATDLRRCATRRSYGDARLSPGGRDSGWKCAAYLKINRASARAWSTTARDRRRP